MVRVGFYMEVADVDNERQLFRRLVVGVGCYTEVVL